MDAILNDAASKKRLLEKADGRKSSGYGGRVLINTKRPTVGSRVATAAGFK